MSFAGLLVIFCTEMATSVEESSPSQDSPQNTIETYCVAYVLSYRDPNYIRTQSLLQALTRAPGIRLVLARNTSSGIRRYLETLRSLRNLQAVERPDIYLLGFRGHEIFWPVRFLIKNAPLIVDAFMSPSAALSEEHRGGWIGKILAPMIGFLERQLLQNAQYVLTDTRLHADFLARMFSLQREKIYAMPVGAIETDMPKIENRLADGAFRVLFYGSFLPLHGVNVIVAAAAMLKELPIAFDFVGGTTRRAKCLHEQCKSLGVENYTYRKWVPISDLIATEIPQASLCLGGPFGATPQARRVITSKTSQCLAQGRPTVVGQIDESAGFVNRENCLLVAQGDARALADAIRWAFENPDLLPAIGDRGRSLYLERLSIAVVTESLERLLRQAAALESGGAAK